MVCVSGLGFGWGGVDRQRGICVGFTPACQTLLQTQVQREAESLNSLIPGGDLTSRERQPNPCKRRSTSETDFEVEISASRRCTILNTPQSSKDLVANPQPRSNDGWSI